ncbi:MAG: hypothetical protein IKD10_04525 [Lentisphaeria bacterium]|nr:hypothetical protein [Lentisphaeria bacterium]MBR7144187.1 hypothetical protein [Lentisphaeria bacterium]
MLPFCKAGWQKCPRIALGWNSTHGFTVEDVKQDLEGLQTMRTLARNMAYLLKCKKKAILPCPKKEEPVMTNFIK